LVLIFLDAGHGGKDAGAVGNGLKEKDITLDICNRIATGLKAYQNCNVLMTRTSDIFVSLDDRTIKANNANCDLLLSIHCNSSTAGTARGFESHIYTNVDAGTRAFQNVMHGEILKAYGASIDDRGKKQSNFHMLRESKMKAILTENLFVSNPADAALLAKADFRQKIANGHISGLEKFLGLKKSGAQPPPITKLWTVQVGAFEDKENAEAMAKDLLKSGYKAYIKYE
jgi:N-acetylmuramoyl-L-alanine amidase